MKTEPKFAAGDLVGLRLYESDAYLLNRLFEKLGYNKATLLRLGITRLAQQQGINLQKQATPRKKSA